MSKKKKSDKLLKKIESIISRASQNFVSYKYKETYLKKGKYVKGEITLTEYKLKKIDESIADYIARLNEFGYRTKITCSGSRIDHFGSDQPSFLFFDVPRENVGDLELYFRFLILILNQSGWFTDIVYKKESIKAVMGYLPEGLDDEEIDRRFRVLVNYLEKRDYFNVQK